MSDQTVIKIEKYQPSSGIEGDAFMSAYCFQCTKDDGGIGETVCEIIGDTMAYDVDDPKYPDQWRYDAQGCPTCIEFEPRED